MSVFDDLKEEAYPYRFACQLRVDTLMGGTPTDPKVAEGWLKTKLGIDKDDLIREAVAETMVERGVTAEEASVIVNEQKNLNGFKRDPELGLYIEGRHVKAMLKEAASIAVAAGKLELRGWGVTKKWLNGFLAEHVFVPERRIYLGVKEADGVNQRFIHTHRGTGIQYEEFVDDAKVSFTVISDYNFTKEQWAHLWLCGENNGLGASRSQGYGTFEVVQWDRLPDTVTKSRKKA